MPWLFVLQVAIWFRILFKMSKVWMCILFEAGQKAGDYMEAGHYTEMTRKLSLPIRLKLVKKLFKKINKKNYIK